MWCSGIWRVYESGSRWCWGSQYKEEKQKAAWWVTVSFFFISWVYITYVTHLQTILRHIVLEFCLGRILLKGDNITLMMNTWVNSYPWVLTHFFVYTTTWTIHSFVDIAPLFGFFFFFAQGEIMTEEVEFCGLRNSILQALEVT